MPKRGDLVWAKMRSYAWWPGIIIDPDDCGRDKISKNKFWVFWFGDHKVAEIECEKILDFKQYFTEKYNKKMAKSLKNAIQDMLTVLANRDHIKYSDPPSLFNWAEKGFKTNLRVSRDKSVVSSELPDIVVNALNSSKFKRRYQSDSEEDSEDEISNTLEDVYKGHKSLEDICIICCRSECTVIMQHPLFVGGVCQNCKKNMNKVTKVAKGQMQDICILCGLGGDLVYCSYSLCLRSYCKVCIDYMTPRGAYSKIVNDDSWKCYLCRPDLDITCLIKRREMYQSKIVKPPLVPEEKLPIRVIALTNAALSVLKKKNIAIDIYCTESSKCLQPGNSQQYQLYADFSQEEMAEICADFIYGSFFIPSLPIDDRKKCLESLAASFYKFLFRLDNAKLFKSSVFFMFVADDEILDAEVLSRVMRFLRVDPVKIELGSKNICLWSNLPDSKCKNNRLLIKDSKGSKSSEEVILNKFLDPLKKFFKQVSE